MSDIAIRLAIIADIIGGSFSGTEAFMAEAGENYKPLPEGTSLIVHDDPYIPGIGGHSNLDALKLLDGDLPVGGGTLEEAMRVSGKAMPGTIALSDYIIANFGGANGGTYVNRDVRGRPGVLSVHATGRAGDTMVQGAAGDRIAGWLADNADELGIQRIIWNRRSWDMKRREWRPYSGSNPHTDHVHWELTPQSAGGTRRGSVGGKGAVAMVGAGEQFKSVAARLGAIQDLIAGRSPRNVSLRWGGAAKPAGAFAFDTASDDSGGGGGDLGAFMSAVSGQESGGSYTVTNKDSGAHGKFQIMPANWAPWAAEAGLGAGAPRTAENQDRVARFKMAQYHRQFGSWGAVAVAWYAGPSAAAAWVKNPNADRFNRRQGSYPSINAYVRQVLSRMG